MTTLEDEVPAQELPQCRSGGEDQERRRTEEISQRIARQGPPSDVRPGWYDAMMPGSGVEAASYGDLLVTSLVVLGAVCVAAFVVVRVVGRWVLTGRTRGANLLDVIARVPLEPRRSLYVVEVAGKTLLVGTSEMGLNLLAELDGAEVRARASARPTFADLVRGAWQKRGKPTAAGEAAGGGASDGEVS